MTILTKNTDSTFPMPGSFTGHYDEAAVATYTFPAAMTTKLMAEQKWTLDYTTRVLTEYRRFIHLAATMGHEVTPSQIVDEAWHMHLTFSRDYWEKLTPLLPAPLHHEPAEGLPGDGARYAAQYRRTLDDYRATFGHEPPSDIWRVARPRRRAPFLVRPALLWTVLLGAAMSVFFHLSAVALTVLGVIVFLLVGSFAAAMQPHPGDPRKADGSSGGGSCGGAGCGYTGGDSCDSSGSDSSCGDSGGGGCGGGCGGGGCGS